MANEPPKARADDYIDTDDLFGKLDQLISRHQGRTAPRAPGQPVPTLTEAVELEATATQPEIPVLNDVVELAPSATGPLTSLAPLEKQRQLQIALYLQLRQRLDHEFGSDAFAFVPPAQMTQLVQALRNALPGVVRDVVEQVFGDENG